MTTAAWIVAAVAGFCLVWACVMSYTALLIRRYGRRKGRAYDDEIGKLREENQRIMDKLTIHQRTALQEAQKVSPQPDEFDTSFVIKEEEYV